MRQITNYTIQTDKPINLHIAHVSDLHDAEYGDILPTLRGADVIAVTGDLVNNYTKRYERGIAFLKEAAAIAPTFYSLGNHEGHPDKQFTEIVKSTGAVLLDNRFVRWNGNTIRHNNAIHASGDIDCTNGIIIAGLSHDLNPKMLKDLSKQEGFKLLLCHHPEYYHKYIAIHDIDLTLAGHAHGGQIRLFGHGLFAPGQGWLPKLTSGVIDGRLIISRGASNSVGIPRLFNRCEIGIVNIVHKAARY